MTPIRILVSFLLLFVGINVSAQQVSGLSIGKNAHLSVTDVIYGIVYEKGAVEEVLVYKQASYTATPEGFKVFIEQRFQELDIIPIQGMEDANYSLHIQTDWIIHFSGKEEMFKLEKTASGWKLPESALDFEFRYGGISLPLEGIANFEIEMEDGRFFSTVTGENTAGGNCSVPTSRGALTQGVLYISHDLTDPKTPIRRLTAWDRQGLEMVFNGDGVPIELSDPAPSFFKAPELPPARPEIRPLTVNIRLVDRLPMIAVSGDGAERAVIEQSRDGIGNWGPAISLSQPPRLSSFNEGEYLYEFADDAPGGNTAIFYRARISSEPQKQ